MKYAYPLTVVGSQNDTGMYTSPVWNNFIRYVKTKHGLNGDDLSLAQSIVERELLVWYACNDDGCATISFKTPMHLTLFLLRFS
jgi:hypothetical protein